MMNPDALNEAYAACQAAKQNYKKTTNADEKQQALIAFHKYKNQLKGMIPAHFDWAIKQLATDYKAGHERLVFCHTIVQKCQLKKELSDIFNPNALLSPSVMQDIANYPNARGNNKKNLLKKLKTLDSTIVNTAQECIESFSKPNHQNVQIALFKQIMVVKDIKFPTHQTTGNAYRELIATPLKDAGKYDEALIYYNKALEVYNAIPKSDIFRAEALSNMGEVFEAQEKYHEAMSAYQKAVSCNVTPDKKQDIYLCMVRIAKKTQRTDLALGHYQQALSLCEQSAGGKQKHAEILSDMGAILREQGEAEKALEHFEKSRAILTALTQDQKLPHAISIEGVVLNNIGNIHLDKNNLDEALRHYQQSLATFEQIAPNHPGKADALCNIGSVLNRQGHWQQALEHHHKALAIQKQYDQTDVDIADSYLKIGQIQFAQRQLLDAKHSLQKALDTLPHQAKNGLVASDILSHLGHICNDQNHHHEALEHLNEAAKICEQTAPLGTRTASAYINLGNTYRLLGQDSEALSCYDKSYSIQSRHNPNDVGIPRLLGNKAIIHVSRNEYKKGIELYEQALAMQEQSGEKTHAHLTLLECIADAYIQDKQFDKAIESIEKAISICSDTLNKDHYKTNKFKWILANVYIKTSEWHKACLILSEIHTAHHILWENHDAFNFSDYDFFDCSKHSTILAQLSLCEAKLGTSDAPLKRYLDEAAFMQTQNRPLLALLYLQEAKKIANDIGDASKQSEIIHQIADIHQRMGHLHFAKELLDPTLDSAQDPAVSDHHHQLEMLHVSFVKHMLLWHKQMDQSSNHLATKNSSKTAKFFIGFQSLLDQAYNHWISEQLGSKHKGHFPSFQSKPALQAHFSALGLTDIETTDAFKAFEATQPYHLESSPMVGQSWGKVIRALGNLNKHLKISSSGNSDELDHQGLGLFEKIKTSIEIEYPFTQLHPKSFASLVDKASAPLYRALQNKGVICDIDGFINAHHPWFKQLVHGEDTSDTHHTIEDCVGRAAKGIEKLGKINIPPLQAREVATLLVDQVLQITHTRSGSALKIPALGLIEQAFAKTQAWLDAIYETTSPKLTLLGNNIYTPATKLSIPPFFPSATSYKEQVATMLAHVETQLRESMQTQTRSERKGAITGSLIQMRGLLEQAFRDFAVRCICLPNKPKHFPLFKTGLLARLFSSQKADLNGQLQTATIINTTPEKASLERNFPTVLAALHDFWDHTSKLMRIRRLIGWTNDLKHNTSITIDDWEHADGPNAHFNGQTFRLQAFSKETFADIKAFVQVCQEAAPSADAAASTQTPSQSSGPGGGGSK